MDTEEISIGSYIVRRIEEQGVKSMFGVPGSLLAKFLDIVEKSNITWVGECNELNAAYAADGYARFRRGLGVVTTTIGVGELSAINGIAGSFAEELPVLHIVGQQETDHQEQGLNTIHTLGDGRYDAFAKSAIPYTCSQLLLSKTDLGLGVVDAKIDQLIVDCISKSRPAYLALPSDLVDEIIITHRLNHKLCVEEVKIDADAEQAAIDHIYRRFEDAFSGEVKDNVVVIADVSISRHHCKKEAAEFLSVTNLPVYGTPLGKTVVDETSERYGGIYVGDLSSADVKQKVESAKLVLFIGPLHTDFNTGKFSYNIKEERSIKIHFNRTEVGFATYTRTGMKALLPKLAQRLKDFSEKSSQLVVPEFKNKKVVDTPDVDIKHEWLWWRVGGWFQEKDLIITESGSVSYGVIDLALPKDSALLAQKLWASIGWSMGATHGATLAHLELQGDAATQTILFIGDGSLQMTVQELSSMIRSDIKPIIFVINNGGYTIERLQHNIEGEYHNIVTWDYGKLLKVLSSEKSVPTQTYRVTKEEELGNLLDTEKIRDKGCLQLVEVVVVRDDAPPALLRALGLDEKTNTGDAIHGGNKESLRVRLGMIGW
ncbi:putative pyruvate decarboxylase 2 [Phlegmacium glaucopus]|nr:putative pyruvate decarboxylase 2 [Phlegmacium glaucopus]